MKRFGYALLASLLVVTTTSSLSSSAGRFDQKLTVEKQILHVLNRLTFGPRPGDVEQVRRLGVDKWIDLQLHPERISENPTLETRLKPLESLQLASWQISERYPQVPPALAALNRMAPQNAIAALTPQQRTSLLSGPLEERRIMLTSLDPDNRRQVLAGAPPQVLEGLPEEMRQEANKARQADMEARQKEIRRLMPPLNDLLTPEQMRIANGGSLEDKLALLNSLDPEKRQQVVRALPPQAVAGVPELRREGMAARQPQELVNSELIESKLYRAIYSNRQLEEVLVDFWMNHFNVYNGKGPVRVLLTGYERDAIRPHIFGHFRDMLLATAGHPAMLYYLDNWQSQAVRDDLPAPPVIAGAQIRRPGLNENYGRELLELHTLGVNGGYTQED